MDILVRSGSPKTFPPDAPPMSRGHVRLSPECLLQGPTDIRLVFEFLPCDFGKNGKDGIWPKKTWEKWRFFSPQKMNGWNLKIHPWEKGKSSEPKHHFQVFHVNLRGCKVHLGYNSNSISSFSSRCTFTSFLASLNLKGPFSLPNKCFLSRCFRYVCGVQIPTAFFGQAICSIMSTLFLTPKSRFRRNSSKTERDGLFGDFVWWV